MMKMLLRNVTMSELADIYERHQGTSPAPYFCDKKVKERAKHLAQKNGIWEDLKELDPTREIPVLKRSDYRSFKRTGDRSIPEAKANYRRGEIERAVLALWLDHPNADLDYLQDLIWAYCDDWTWVMAAHESRDVDLGAVRIGRTLAEAVHIFQNILEEEVKESVYQAVNQHIFDPARNYRNLDNWYVDRFAWMTARNNWNHVCNGEIISTALYLVSDPAALAHLTHPLIQNLTYGLDGFAEDGGCLEGPGYWAYGFGHFLKTAYALHLKTNGEVNIMADESGKIQRISRFPLATHIDGRLRATFADSTHGYLPAHATLLANAFYTMPELYNLCELHPDSTLKVKNLHELAMYSDFKVTSEQPRQDYFLPDMGFVKMHGKPGQNQMTVVCQAKNNGVSHNHNDIGSFMVYKHGRLPLVDPGAPIYTKKTFGPQRYEIMFCNSFGHSVPVIDGVMQQEGEQYFGSISVENLHKKGTKKAAIDMTHAYPEGTVQKFIRTLMLDTDSNALFIYDTFDFESRGPSSLEESFITFEQVKVSGNTVQIGPQERSVTLSAENCSGSFEAVSLDEESKEGKSGEVVTRIKFTPDSLGQTMRLAFKII